MDTREWILAAAVILVPLAIAAIVTMWSLEQARYRPKRHKSAAPPEERRSPGEGSGTGG